MKRKENDMSREYDNYIQQHKDNVRKGYEWMTVYIPHLMPRGLIDAVDNIVNHDESKNEPDEYFAYDKYFYGKNKSYQVMQDFNLAWLRHIHRNPHHWQHWILINDDPKEGEIILDMPLNYIIEMICDWWAFSWNKGDLTEIFKWYDEHKDYIKLSPKTRKTVEDILEQIKTKLSESDTQNE